MIDDGHDAARIDELEAENERLRAELEKSKLAHEGASDSFTKTLSEFLRDWSDWSSQEMYGECFHDGWEEKDRDKLFAHIEALWAELARREGKPWHVYDHRTRTILAHPAQKLAIEAFKREERAAAEQRVLDAMGRIPSAQLEESIQAGDGDHRPGIQAAVDACKAELARREGKT